MLKTTMATTLLVILFLFLLTSKSANFSLFNVTTPSRSYPTIKQQQQQQQQHQGPSAVAVMSDNALTTSIRRRTTVVSRQLQHISTTNEEHHHYYRRRRSVVEDLPIMMRKKGRSEGDKIPPEDKEEVIINIGDDDDKNPCSSQLFRKQSIRNILKDHGIDGITASGLLDDTDIVNIQKPSSSSSSSSSSTKAYDWLLHQDGVMKKSTTCQKPIRVLQRYALAVLYHSTHGETWKHHVRNSWLQPTDECRGWYRILCEKRKIKKEEDDDETIVVQVVTEIDLSRNSLYGTIPTEIGLLSNLQVVSLWRNSLSGTIPFAVSKLQDLRILDLEKNRLSGYIVPSAMDKMKKLETLRLSYNLLMGNFTDIVMKATAGNTRRSTLKEIGLSQTLITGTIPTAIGWFTKLEQLILNDNTLRGTLVSEILELPSLRKVWLQHNHFTGSIPMAGVLTQTNTLKELRLEGNYL
jgi:hypothetical protein